MNFWKVTKIILGTLAVVVLVEVVVLKIDLHRPIGEFTQAKGEFTQDNYDQTTESVSWKLVTPSVAKFSPYSKDSVERLPDGKFKVTGYVDSQNVYGAMLRSNWAAIVTLIGDRIVENYSGIGFDGIANMEADWQLDSPANKAETARSKALRERDAAEFAAQEAIESKRQDDQIASDRLEEEQRMGREQATKEAMEAKQQEQQIAADRLAEEQRVERERAAKEVRMVTVSKPVPIKSKYGTVTIPVGAKVKILGEEHREKAH